MITGIIILVILIFLSAFFSGMESAFISLGEIDLIEISKSGKKNRRILLRLLENKEKLLSTILIGNNIVNIAATALNTTLAIRYSIELGLSEELTVTISAVILTLTIILFGEIVPKTIAINHNRKLALLNARGIWLLSIILTPISFFLDKISKLINLLFRSKDLKNQITESTVINVVSKGEEQGMIKETEKKLIQNVFLFDEREVYPVMTPRTAVFALEDSLTLGEVQDELLEKQFSRIPVYSNTIDNITGIINLKTAFKELLENKKDVSLHFLAQKPLFVYETMSLTSLLEKFKSEQNHMAIVVDEFGGMAGIVTLEDILEELVGEIYDEKDEVSSLIRKLGEKKWLIRGRIDIMTVNKYILGDIEIDGEFETLQGLIMSKLNRLPVVGDSLYIDPHRFTVSKMRKNQILSVVVEYNPVDTADESELSE
ncbi:hemolysin family protein [bacterium]|nr:hemolysin family protein [bacterium]